jgi:hypothetical protein
MVVWQLEIITQGADEPIGDKGDRERADGDVPHSESKRSSWREEAAESQSRPLFGGHEGTQLGLECRKSAFDVATGAVEFPGEHIRFDHR